jgi:23S rRNA G2445 N2-methylase RlmL
VNALNSCNTKGTITGLDIFPDFIGKLNTNAEKLGLQNKVKGIVASMDNLRPMRKVVIYPQ